jgi:hypothetical protein
VYSALKITPNIYGVATRTFGQQIFWAGFVGLPVALLIPELVYRFVQRSIFPTVCALLCLCLCSALPCVVGGLCVDCVPFFVG